jgi:ribose 5-phosphate isomerase B
VLAMGGRVVNDTLAVEMVQTFLSTAYADGRHQRRIDKITHMEKKNQAAQKPSKPAL